jgi:putative addiction module antidote
MLQVTTIRRIGNSLGVIIPAEAAKALGFSEGARVVLQADGESVRIEPMTPGMEDTMAVFQGVCQRYDGVFRELARE